ncbi:hypothetical protein FGB62_380g06 [Gracilaria domingensis]|nr:hypothetical protein FGB62_380g06 [Gracilaria domingensis]
MIYRRMHGASRWVNPGAVRQYTSRAALCKRLNVVRLAERRKSQLALPGGAHGPVRLCADPDTAHALPPLHSFKTAFKAPAIAPRRLVLRRARAGPRLAKSLHDVDMQPQRQGKLALGLYRRNRRQTRSQSQPAAAAARILCWPLRTAIHLYEKGSEKRP